MLELSIVRADAAPPTAPDAATPGVEVWRHHDGTVIAYGGSRDGEHWMAVPGVATFSFAGGREHVTAQAATAADEDLVVDAFRRIVLPMALQRLGSEALHASAVVGRDGVVAFCAVSETGKSTVAYALSRRGYPLWADDAVAFEIDGHGVEAIPLPFALRLRAGSAEFFGVEEVPPGNGAAPDARRPLAAVCVLERAEIGDTGAAVVGLSAVDALPAVLTHAYCFTLQDRERNRQMIEAYMDLVSRVPVFRVRVRPGLESLSGVLDELESALDGVSTKPR